MHATASHRAGLLRVATRAPLSATLPATLIGGALLGGCAEWPRHANLPGGPDTGALPAGTDPAGTVQVDWRGPVDEAESGTRSGLPVGTVEPLAPGQGVLFDGTLAGTGWDGDSAPDRDGECGTLAFPVGGGGTYAADVDWVAVEATGPATLCVTVELDRELQFDAVPYRLDDCDEPAVVVADRDGQPYGYDAGGGGVTWSLPVDAGQRIGVALGAFWPQDPDQARPWRLGAALTDTGLCPNLPEDR